VLRNTAVKLQPGFLFIHGQLPSAGGKRTLTALKGMARVGAIPYMPGAQVVMHTAGETRIPIQRRADHTHFLSIWQF
jgi:hypothetical protein